MQHIQSTAKILNQFYEWPKTRQEYNIFFKETFRVPDFWKDMGKKVSFGLVAAGGDTAVKLAAWQYIFGGTWSPVRGKKETPQDGKTIPGHRLEEKTKMSRSD